MEGIERIKVLASEVKDEAVLEIVNYLISRTDMNEKYLNEEKSLKQMIDFIVGQAKKKAKNNRAIVKDEVVFGWAIHYWDEPNNKLNIEEDNEEKEEQTTSKAKETSSLDSAPKVKKSWVAEGQLSLF